MIDLSGRVALVTGAGSGIGQATARMLARAGARVAALDIDEDRVATMAAEGMLGLTGDVTRPDDLRQAMDRAVAELGGLDIVYANAGIGGTGDVVDLPLEQWDRMIEVNLDGVFFTVRAALPYIKRSAHGRVICTASHFGVMGWAGMASYSAAKGGVIGLVRSLALELGPVGATANAVAPGPVLSGLVQRTPEQIRQRAALLPLGRLGQPEDVAGAVTFLASDLASWITGHVLQVNGGELFQ